MELTPYVIIGANGEIAECKSSSVEAALAVRDDKWPAGKVYRNLPGREPALVKKDRDGQIYVAA